MRLLHHEQIEAALGDLIAFIDSHFDIYSDLDTVKRARSVLSLIREEKEEPSEGDAFMRHEVADLTRAALIAARKAREA